MGFCLGDDTISTGTERHSAYRSRQGDQLQLWLCTGRCHALTMPELLTLEKTLVVAVLNNMCDY